MIVKAARLVPGNVLRRICGWVVVTARVDTENVKVFRDLAIIVGDELPHVFSVVDGSVRVDYACGCERTQDSNGVAIGQLERRIRLL